MEVQVRITTKELKKELEKRGFHVIPRRSTGSGGNFGLTHCDVLGLNTCDGCGRLEHKCNCKG